MEYPHNQKREVSRDSTFVLCPVFFCEWVCSLGVEQVALLHSCYDHEADRRY